MWTHRRVMYSAVLMLDNGSTETSMMTTETRTTKRNTGTRTKDEDNMRPDSRRFAPWRTVGYPNVDDVRMSRFDYVGRVCDLILRDHCGKVTMLCRGDSKDISPQLHLSCTYRFWVQSFYRCLLIYERTQGNGYISMRTIHK